MRISGWSADVCSSDLVFQCPGGDLYVAPQGLHGLEAQARQHQPVVLDIEVEQCVTAARAAISVAVARDGGGGKHLVERELRWAAQPIARRPPLAALLGPPGKIHAAPYTPAGITAHTTPR